jgi:hypothetical protein
LVRLGLSKDWELRVETTGAYIWDRVSDPASGVTKSQGADPVSLGLKYHFQDTAGISQPSLAPFRFGRDQQAILAIGWLRR